MFVSPIHNSENFAKLDRRLQLSCTCMPRVSYKINLAVDYSIHPSLALAHKRAFPVIIRYCDLLSLQSIWFLWRETASTWDAITNSKPQHNYK